ALQETNNVLEQRVQDRTAALTRSNSDLAQFAYIASHDLKEPLRMVTNYVQLIEKRYSGQLDETGKLFMSYAVEGATRANRLIEDLLAYAKIDRKRHQKYVATDLNAIMRQVTQNLSLYIKEQKATVIIDDLPEIEAIPSQMIQLFQNLISNAIKFQRSNTLPQVEIMATEINNHFQFSIKDNGIGIDKTYTNKVFKIFQRLNPRNEYKGTGIGLAVCKKIAEGHGGQIWFDSMPNQGTTFYIALPKRQTQFVPSPVLPQEESVSFNIENTLYVAA
ncbi:MAG: sensor histidine kinase, partial [Chitinophagales bacterium]